MRVLTTIFLAAIVFSGCATQEEFIAPDFDRAKEFSGTKDKVWEAVIDYFAGRNIPIKTLEKDSGLIYAETLIASVGYGETGDFFRYAACPKKWSVVYVGPATVSVNVLVTDIQSGDDSVSVQVNTRHRVLANVYAVLATVPQTVECSSSGYIEGAIHNHVEEYLRTSTPIRPPMESANESD
ncbi:MAG: hypothetical protein OXF94_09730 [Gammaproteobacteria bacterium]|nr:hypothetical protein [Gammaproteobacteria bacterium]